MIALTLTHGAVRAHHRAIGAKSLLVALVVLLAVAGLVSAVSTPLGPDEASFIAGL